MTVGVSDFGQGQWNSPGVSCGTYPITRPSGLDLGSTFQQSPIKQLRNALRPGDGGARPLESGSVSDETSVTTEKFSLVTKSLGNGLDRGLLSRVDLYPSVSLVVTQ